MRHVLLTVLSLFLVAGWLPRKTVAQYSPKYLNPTSRLLDQEYPTGFKDLHLCTLRDFVGLNLKFEFSVGQQLQLSADSNTNTGREILDIINATDDYKTLIREWEVLVVSDVDDQQIKDLCLIARDLKHDDHAAAIDQLLTWSHPSIYPSLFWVMKHDTPAMAKKVSRALLANHGELMEYSPSFENALEGFKRSFENEEWKYLSFAYNLPEPILKNVDPKEWLGKNRNEYLEQKVAQAKLTFADMKREYAKAPSSPDASPLCGTGYVHVYNHFDYASMIGDLRTEEAYAFLNAQAKKLAEDPTAVNQDKLAELAIALSNRDNDDALTILRTIVDQQGLDQPATTISLPDHFLAINTMAGALKVFAATGQSKYTPIFRAFCNSSDAGVRREAFVILQRRQTPDLFEIGLQGLSQLADESAKAKTEDEKTTIERSRYHAASILSVLRTDEVKQHFLKRLGEAGNEMEAAGYLSKRLADQSLETLKKMISIEGLPPELAVNLRLELLNRNDSETIASVLKRMELRYAELIETFKRTYPHGLNHKKYNGWLCYLDHDIQRLRSLPQSLSRGMAMLDSENTAVERMTGAIMIYTAAYELITDDVAESLAKCKDDPEPLVAEIVTAILDGRSN